jgi:hypothetical protein
VSSILGVSLLSLKGPGVSALNICLPPTPSRGRIATAKTIKPIPPSHCSKQRHRFTEIGRVSSPDSTVAPVVVIAELVSK